LKLSPFNVSQHAKLHSPHAVVNTSRKKEQQSRAVPEALGP